MNRNLVLLGIFLLFMRADVVFGDKNQIRIDKLTSDYLASEKALWKKIDTQLILLDRGSLLNEIYHEHLRILNNDFGENRILWSLGIQKYERLINIVLSIDTNVKNVKDYLAKSEYVKLTDLAKNAAQQMQKSTDDLNGIIGQRSFWDNLVDVRKHFIRCVFYTSLARILLINSNLILFRKKVENHASWAI